MDRQTSSSAMLATDAVAFLPRTEGCEPLDLNIAYAHDDESMRPSNGLADDDGDETTQSNTAHEHVKKVVATKKALAEEARESTPFELLSNSTGDRLEDHVEEPSSRGRVDMPPFSHRSARNADPQRSRSRPQEASSSTPTTVNVARLKSIIAASTLQREQPNKRTHPTLPEEGPSNVMPGQNSVNLQPAVLLRPLTFVQTLQSEFCRIYTDREKVRDEMMRARSTVGDLQSLLVQLGKKSKALQRENEALRRENEELQGNRILDTNSAHHC